MTTDIIIQKAQSISSLTGWPIRVGSFCQETQSWDCDVEGPIKYIRKTFRAFFPRCAFYPMGTEVKVEIFH